MTLKQRDASQLLDRNSASIAKDPASAKHQNAPLPSSVMSSLECLTLDVA